MSEPDRYEALMLEHLYGLLEPDEARELQAYLATPEGSDLRARAETWQAKLTGAAKVPFPDVEFAPPVVVPARKPAVEQRAVPIKAVWIRWAVAASLLFVFGGLGGPAAYQFFGWYRQTQETEQKQLALNEKRNTLAKLESDHQSQRDAISKEKEDANAAFMAAQTAYRDAIASARKTAGLKDIVVRLTGPDRVEPGAPNAWTIETVDRQGRITSPQKMDVVVRDEKDNELLRQTHDRPRGPTSLQLPTSIWAKVRPGSDLFVDVVAYTDDNRTSALAERLPLARPVYVTHLVTDKPLYRPGEMVRYRSLTLDRATFLPPTREQHLKFRLTKPDGAGIDLGEANGRVMMGSKAVQGPDGKPLRGIGVGEYELRESLPGGEYVLEVFEVGAVSDEKLLAMRKFAVASYAVDVFEKKLEFDGKSYGPGDSVQARIEVSTTASRTLRDPRADIVASIDDREFHTEKNVRLQIISDTQSQRPRLAVHNVRFKVPPEAVANRKPADVKLSVTIRDGKTSELIVRPIPLVEKDLVVEFFAEGGDLVEGVPGRVYFQVRTPSGKPTDLKGTITDGTKVVAEVATVTDAEHPGVNRGQGVFTITPSPGTKYFLKLRSPTGINEPTKDGFPLPVVKSDGIVLTALDTVTEKGAPIRVSVQTAKGPKTLHVGAYARGRLISHQRVEVEAGKPVEVKLQGDEALGGVTRITVFEEPKADEGKRANLIPRAERLVYRRPGEQLQLTVKPDNDAYSPASKVALELGAQNEKGQPAPAILMVAVVNQSVIAMADNKTDRLLPTHFLLAGEVKNPAELEHADFLLTDHPKAAAALDMLLGTQGWRRFAEQNVRPASPIDREEVERMLVAHGRASTPLEHYRLEEERIVAEHLPKVEQSANRFREARTAAEEFQTKGEADFRSRQTTAQAHVTLADDSCEKAAAELYHFETRGVRLRSFALPLFLIGLIGIVAGAIAVAVSRPSQARRPYFVTAGVSVVLAALVITAIGVTHPTNNAENAYYAEQRKQIEGYMRKSTTVIVPPKGPQAAPVIGKEQERKMDPPDDPAIGEMNPKWSIKGPKHAAKDQAEAKEPPKFVRLPGAPAVPWSIVREYAHVRDPRNQSQDQTETVYWHPVLVLPDTGRATVEFQLSDDVAGYQVLVAGHTIDGRIGAVTKTIEARKNPAGD